jgi:hypothetical protein
MSSVLDRIDRAARHLGGELSRLRGEQIMLLPASLDRVAAAISSTNLSDADEVAIASLMCSLLVGHLEGTGLLSRCLRTLAYFMCLRELRTKVRHLNGKRLGLFKGSGAWAMAFRTAWTAAIHRFYFSWFAIAGIAYLVGLSPNIKRPIAGILSLAIEPV